MNFISLGETHLPNRTNRTLALLQRRLLLVLLQSCGQILFEQSLNHLMEILDTPNVNLWPKQSVSSHEQTWCFERFSFIFFQLGRWLTKFRLWTDWTIREPSPEPTMPYRTSSSSLATLSNWTRLCSFSARRSTRCWTACSGSIMWVCSIFEIVRIHIWFTLSHLIWFPSYSHLILFWFTTARLP